MALVTSNSLIPDLEQEYHTVLVDTIGQSNKGTFTVHLQQELENVVQVRLLAAQVRPTSTSNVCSISVQELDSQFTQRATNEPDGQSSLSTLNRAFATIIDDGAGKFNFRDQYPILQQYITPIRKISRLNIVIRDQTGQPISGTLDNYFIFKFTCKNKNLPGH
jgi:hypothetical protein